MGVIKLCENHRCNPEIESCPFLGRHAKRNSSRDWNGIVAAYCHVTPVEQNQNEKEKDTVSGMVCKIRCQAQHRTGCPIGFAPVEGLESFLRFGQQRQSLFRCAGVRKYPGQEEADDRQIGQRRTKLRFEVRL